MFKNMKLGVKLGLGFTVPVLLIVIIGVFSIGAMDASNQRLGTVYNDRVVPLNGLKKIADSYAVNVIDAINKTNAGFMNVEEMRKHLDDAMQTVKQEWAAYMATELTEEEAALAKDAGALFIPADAAIRNLYEEVKNKSGFIKYQLNDFNGAMYEHIDPISNKISELIELQLRVAAQEYAASQEAYDFQVKLDLTLIVLAVLSASIIGLIITRSLLRELGGEPAYAASVVTDIANGDLSIDVITKSGDQSSMLFSIKNMVDKLSDVICEVRGSANSITSASEQVSSTAQSVSQATTEQAASLEETSSAVEQMSASVNQNADNARVTEGMASKAASQASEGGDAVHQTVNAMKQIAEKIGIVDDIAYQTNLLALNAAIEAGRAGDHGKGFAVVASEVRKLAERSQVAAREIGEVAKNSVNLAERAGSLLEEMVPAISKTSDLVQEISAASNEQSTGLAQVNTAMNQMNQVTQQNAAASEELAATAEEMNGQAEQLAEIVTFFKVKAAEHKGFAKVDSPKVRTSKKPALASRAATDADSDSDFVRF